MQTPHSARSDSFDTNHEVSCELATREEHLTGATIYYKDKELADDKAKAKLLSLALPEGWSNDKSKQCLKYAMAMMLAAISEQDQELACAQEDTSNEYILSILVSNVDDEILPEPIVEGIIAVFKRRIETVLLGESPSESSTTLVVKRGQYHYTTSMTIKAGGSEYHWADGDIKFLLVHLHTIRQDVARLLLLWTWSKSGPKLKWEQCEDF